MLPGLNFSSNIGLRPARSSDQDFFEQLYKDSRTDLWLIDKDKDFIEELIDQQWRARESYYAEAFPSGMFFVIEIQGDRAGRLVLDFGPNEVRIVDLHIAPGYQGKGFGKELMIGIQGIAETNAIPLTLTVDRQNIGAKRLYQLLGFVVDYVDDMADFMVWTPRQNDVLLKQP